MPALVVNLLRAGAIVGLDPAAMLAAALADLEAERAEAERR